MQTYVLLMLLAYISHEEGLASIRKHLDNRENKEVTTDTLVELADIVLKSNCFQFVDKTFKKEPGNPIGTKFAPHFLFCSWQI